MTSKHSRLFNSWYKAAQALGIEIRGPLAVTTEEGDDLECEMLVPYFGSLQGTVVFTEFQDDGLMEKLQRNGYCCSTFGPVPDGYIAPRSQVAEVLADWGWCGPEERKPTWLP